MPALRSITARSLRHVDRVDIELSPEGEAQRSHLVIVGPNGCGKSTLLAAIAEEAQTVVDGRPHPARLIALGGEEDPERVERETRMAHLGRPVRLGWSREERSLPDDFAAGLLLLVSLPASREVAFVAPGPSPHPIETGPRRIDVRVADRLILLLAARNHEVRLARASGDHLRARVHEAWQLRVQSGLRRILSEPQLRLGFSGDAPHLDLPDGRRLAIEELSRGHAAAVAIWAEVMIRVEAARLRADRPGMEPAALVIIDAPEADLEARLQRELLAALVELYPRIQLVVATHSPLVAMSLDHALVYDLGRREGRSSHDIRRGGIEALLASMIGVGSPRPEEPTPEPAVPAPSLPEVAPAELGSPKDTIPTGLRAPPIRPPARLGTSLDAPSRARKVDKRMAPKRAPSAPPPAQASSRPRTAPPPPGRLPPRIETLPPPAPGPRPSSDQGTVDGPWDEREP